MRQTGSYKWLLVISLAVMVNVGYEAMFYAFSVLLGEDAAAREFSRMVLSASLGLGIIVSGALALLVGTLCDVMGPRRVFLAGAVVGSASLAAFSPSWSEGNLLIPGAHSVRVKPRCYPLQARRSPGTYSSPGPSSEPSGRAGERGSLYVLGRKRLLMTRYPRCCSAKVKQKRTCSGTLTQGMPSGFRTQRVVDRQESQPLLPLTNHLSAGKGRDVREGKVTPRFAGLSGAAGEGFEPSLTDPEIGTANIAEYRCVRKTPAKGLNFSTT
jgi:hypothetical protein